MALSKDDRISISKKLIQIPQQNAQADTAKSQLESLRQEAEKEDNGNKELMNEKTPLINAYQDEIGRYDGNKRTELVEQDIIDSVNKVDRNPFFPNDEQVSLPNIPNGVWTNFPPFSGNKAIGKKYDETYDSIQKEQDIIDDINAQIAIIENEPDPTRSTGQECVVDSGTGTETIQNDSVMQQAAIDMKSAVQNWEDFLNTTYGIIPTTDPDSTRSAENIASRDDIDNAITQIDTWQALDDFDTSHGCTDCSCFNNIDVSTLSPTKFRANELQIIKDEISARQSFISTRISQIQGYLGSINQDFNNGEIVSTSGFYGERFRFIDLRLNLMNGSLSKLKGLEDGQNAQDELKKSNDNAVQAYSSKVVATAFRAPAAGTGTIHVKDASNFSIGDSVYIIADKQQEISATINNIQNNTVFLDTNIPKKYRQDANARLYKVL